MNNLQYYNQFRKAGRTASQALAESKAITEFNRLKELGFVSFAAEEEQENYFSIYGIPDDPKEIEQINRFIDLYGIWHLKTEYQDPKGKMQIADSIGMCLYKDPTDPFENWYVSDLCAAAVNAYYETFANTCQL